MKIELVPLLQMERELYEIPRGWDRFRQYLQILTGGRQDLLLPPLVALNPMGKEHVSEALDGLLALDAERIAKEAITEAERRLADVSADLRLGLVLADDAGGGWTHRHLSEMQARFGGDYAPKHDWAVVLFWSSEPASRDTVHAEVLSAIYRAPYALRHGVPRTLRQMMEQEGLTATFAGLSPPALDPAELSAIRDVIAPRRDSSATPVIFACLYGDDAALEVGYPPLGLPPNAGYILARIESQLSDSPPEAALF